MRDSDLVLVVSGTDIMSIVHWHKAIGAIVSDNAYILESNGKVIRSQNLEIPFPEVILQKRTLPPRLLRPPIHARTVFERDNYTCQYVGCHNPQPGEKYLEMEHVLPKSRGGKKEWTNIVTACRKCNSKKKNMTPEEAGMKLVRQPQPLDAATLATNLKRAADRHVKESWKKYIDAYSKRGL